MSDQTTSAQFPTHVVHVGNLVITAKESTGARWDLLIEAEGEADEVTVTISNAVGDEVTWEL